MIDKRHQRRIKAVQELFSLFYHGSQLKPSSPLVSDIAGHSQQLDEYIDEFAKLHSSDELAKIDLSVLRLAVYELLIEKKTPPKVVINEAVELAKEFGSEKSPAFVNAILGGLYKKYQ